MPANEPMPVPATPTRWMRRTAPGELVSRTLPLSSATALGGEVGEFECLHDEVVEDGTEFADAQLLAAVRDAVGDERHHEGAAQVHPEAGAGEAEVAHRARRCVADEVARAGQALGGRIEAHGAG